MIHFASVLSIIIFSSPDASVSFLKFIHSWCMQFMPSVENEWKKVNLLFQVASTCVFHTKFHAHHSWLLQFQQVKLRCMAKFKKIFKFITFLLKIIENSIQSRAWILWIPGKYLKKKMSYVVCFIKNVCFFHIHQLWRNKTNILKNLN